VDTDSFNFIFYFLLLHMTISVHLLWTLLVLIFFLLYMSISVVDADTKLFLVAVDSFPTFDIILTSILASTL
jgi:hypothetical protein